MWGLANALRLAEVLQFEHHFPMEVMVAGKLTSAQVVEWKNRSPVPLTLLGVIPREQIPQLDRSAHIFFSAEPESALPECGH